MLKVDKTDIKKKRTLKIFINAAAQIIEQEGIEGVTIRKVAQIAGYNSATIYNYFDNITQLVSMAAMKFIDDYVHDLPNYVEQADNEMEEFLAIWRCFCKHCFENPEIYYAVFTEDIGDKPDNLIGDYYSLYPKELENIPDALTEMLTESDFAKRCRIMITPCIEAKYFTLEEAEEINELIRLIYQGMLSLIINNRIDYSAEEATTKVMKHIRKIVKKRTTFTPEKNY